MDATQPPASPAPIKPLHPHLACLQDVLPAGQARPGASISDLEQRKAQTPWGSFLSEQGVDGYGEGDALPNQFRELLLQVVLVQADAESILLFNDYFRNLLDFAPSPRHKMRIAKYHAEEINHGYIFYRMLKGLGLELSADYFVLSARKRQYAFDYIYSLNDWVELAVMNVLADRMGVYVFKDMASCSYKPWAKISWSVARDEMGHTAMGYAHLREAIQDPQQFKYAQELIYDKWYPATLDMFGRSDSERQWGYIGWGLKEAANEELRLAWKAEVDPLLTELGFELPSYDHHRRFM
jgi:ring-1,2-phenylacetyl-CoA epoxidase subunit PaaA